MDSSFLTVIKFFPRSNVIFFLFFGFFLVFEFLEFFWSFLEFVLEFLCLFKDTFGLVFGGLVVC